MRLVLYGTPGRRRMSPFATVLADVAEEQGDLDEIVDDLKRDGGHKAALQAFRDGGDSLRPTADDLGRIKHHEANGQRPLVADNCLNGCLPLPPTREVLSVHVHPRQLGRPRRRDLNHATRPRPHARAVPIPPAAVEFLASKPAAQVLTTPRSAVLHLIIGNHRPNGYAADAILPFCQGTPTA